MAYTEHTAEEYRAHLHAHNDDLLDQVQSYGEWAAFKAGVALWLEDIDGQYDQLARDEEQGLEP